MLVEPHRETTLMLSSPPSAASLFAWEVRQTTNVGGPGGAQRDTSESGESTFLVVFRNVGTYEATVTISDSNSNRKRPKARTHT